jgi:peptide/nickel transport system substrate-binding protein
MKIFRAIGAVVVAAALAMGTVSASQAAGSTLKLGAIIKPTSLAADQAEYGNKVWYYQALYDSVLRKNEAGRLLPGIATKWYYNSSQTILTLELREGVKFTDGTALDADAVIKNLVANRDSNGPTANYLSSMKSAKAKDSKTVIITLKSVDPSFLEYLADSSGLLASPKVIGKASAATSPVGSGPYILDKTKTVAGSTYTYKANPTYWDKANRKYDNLVIKVYEDTTAMSNAIKSGAVQGGNVWPQYVADLKKAGFKTASGYLDVKGIYFGKRNADSGSCVSDVYVRRAINTIFDRAAMLKALDNGMGQVTTQYLPTYNAGYDKALNSKYKYSEADAKGLMAESKFPNGCTITMPTFTPVFGESVYAIIKAQLAKLNITVVEVEETGGTFLANIFASKYDAYLMMFERSSNAWTLINFMISKEATFNNDRYTEAKVTSYIESYKTASDTKRVSILKAMNKELVNNAWFVPFYTLQSNFVHKGITVKSAQAGNVIPFLYNIK